jgi:hypothetical protein
MSESAEERIAAAFNSCFAAFEIRIRPEDVTPGARRAIRERGWLIAYRVDAGEGGSPALELYATHRMTSDRHVRISADGTLEELDAIWEAYAFKPDVPGSEEAAKRRYLEHNRTVAEQLRDRGLYPDGDVNAYLRTGGDEPAGS